MTTHVTFEVKAPPGLTRRWMTTLAERMLEALELGGEELSVLLTDDGRIRELNREHRDEDKATDVLAFPMDFEQGAPSAGPGRLLGDVVISLDTARRQALAADHALKQELAMLLAHGLLHLIGHDHGNAREKRKMDAETARILRAAGKA